MSAWASSETSLSAASRPRGSTLGHDGVGPHLYLEATNGRHELPMQAKSTRETETRKPRPLSDLYVEDERGCWVFRYRLDRYGYGKLTRGGRTLIAHRYVYEKLVGPIPDGLELDHLCGVPACVNPAHLEPVTREENARRTRKSHCKRGHAREPGNLYRGGVCIACQRERNELTRIWTTPR